jgi:hypothetical protein
VAIRARRKPTIGVLLSTPYKNPRRFRHSERLSAPWSLLRVDADALEGLSDGGEFVEGRLEVLDDLGCDDAGGGEVVGVLEALVA